MSMSVWKLKVRVVNVLFHTSSNFIHHLLGLRKIVSFTGPPTSTPVKPSVEPCIVESPIVGCQEQSPVKCSLDGSTANNLTTPHEK